MYVCTNNLYLYKMFQLKYFIFALFLHNNVNKSTRYIGIDTNVSMQVQYEGYEMNYKITKKKYLSKTKVVSFYIDLSQNQLYNIFHLKHNVI